MHAFKIDVGTVGQVRTALLAGVEELVDQTRKLRRNNPAAGLAGSAHHRAAERVEVAWNDFADGVEQWANHLESSITRVGTVGSAAAETDDAVADALDRLA